MPGSAKTQEKAGRHHQFIYHPISFLRRGQKHQIPRDDIWTSIRGPRPSDVTVKAILISTQIKDPTGSNLSIQAEVSLPEPKLYPRLCIFTARVSMYIRANIIYIYGWMGGWKHIKQRHHAIIAGTEAIGNCVCIHNAPKEISLQPQGSSANIV